MTDLNQLCLAPNPAKNHHCLPPLVYFFKFTYLCIFKVFFFFKILFIHETERQAET